jgi:F0F1-type ATP synthase membrane subunit b/b'
MNRLIFGAFSVVVSTTIAAGPEPYGSALREEGMALFEDFKALESRSHQQRIEMLQKAEACIQAAETPLAYRECEQRERAERRAMREFFKAERQQLRQRRMALKEKRLAAQGDPM